MTPTPIAPPSVTSTGELDLVRRYRKAALGYARLAKVWRDYYREGDVSSLRGAQDYMARALRHRYMAREQAAYRRALGIGKV